MYCIYCGNQIPDNSELCRYCGREVPEELIRRAQAKPTPMPTPAPISTPIPQPKKKRKKGAIITLIIVAALVANLLLGATVGVIAYLCQFLPETSPDFESIPTPTQNNGSGITDNSDFQNLLMQKWSRSGSFTDNYYVYNVTYTLDITQSALTCSYNLSNEEFTVAAFGYEVVSGNKIKRKGADFSYTITFNDAKNVMTISPAISSSEESEIWYLTGSSSTSSSPSSSNALTTDVYKNWTRTDGGDGTYIKHELEFGEDWFSYSYSLQNAGGGGTNYSFKVISENQVEDIDTGIIYTFTFNDQKNVMTVSPAISSNADSELWFYMGD